MKLYSEQGNLLLRIVRNEWVSGDPLPWDIQAGWQELTIRERHGRISLSLKAKETPAELNAKFWYNSKLIECNNKFLHISQNNVNFRGNFAFVGGPVAIERDSVHIGKAPDAKIIVWANERERLWKAKEEWQRILRLRSKGTNGELG
jgi:hypothetical protein